MTDIEKEKCIIMKEIEKERKKENLIDLVNKKWRHNSPKENDRLKKEIDKCVGQFYPGLQQCKGKGPAQYPV